MLTKGADDGLAGVERDARGIAAVVAGGAGQVPLGTRIELPEGVGAGPDLAGVVGRRPVGQIER